MVLEDILRRYTHTGASGKTPLPIQRNTVAPLVVNGLPQLLTHLSEQLKRIDQLEAEVKELRARVDQIQPPLR